MAGMEGEIGEVLKAPEKVLQSATDEHAHLFYRHLERTNLGGKWLCVVVKYSGDDAFVLTSYLTDKPKKGEQLWPKK